MSKQEFQDAVMAALKKDEYAGDYPEEDLKAAMEECQDVIDGAYEEACGPDSFGFDWHANNAAWNIYLCCF